jgi:hypothetical protein
MVVMGGSMATDSWQWRVRQDVHAAQPAIIVVAEGQVAAA